MSRCDSGETRLGRVRPVNEGGVMPVSGFKVGDTVITPSGNRATVVRVRRFNGREKVFVAYYGQMLADRWFYAGALRHMGGAVGDA